MYTSFGQPIQAFEGVRLQQFGVVRGGRGVMIVLIVRRSPSLGDGCCSVQVRSLSSAGQRDCPHREVILDLRRDLSMHNARNDSAPLSCRSCWVSTAARFHQPRAQVGEAERLAAKEMEEDDGFQRPSSLRMACSIPAAADAGVCARLLTGASLTFACALVASSCARNEDPHGDTRQRTD